MTQSAPGVNGFSAAPTVTPICVLTVGHSNLPAADLVRLLRAHGVQTVVDVRSAPYSRYVPQFNRETLSDLLEDAGIEYRYAGDFLGGRPADPTCYFNGQVPEGKANYLELVNYPEVATRPWFQRGLARLEQLAQEGPTAVLCSEEDPLRCHRHRLIARALAQHDVAVRHIRSSGDLEDAAITDARIAREEGSTQLALFEGLA